MQKFKETTTQAATAMVSKSKQAVTKATATAQQALFKEAKQDEKLLPKNTELSNGGVTDEKPNGFRGKVFIFVLLLLVAAVVLNHRKLTSSPDPCKVLVVGSSVALGKVATSDQGWAWQLGQELSSRYALSYTNVAESGKNTSTMVPQLEAALATYSPRVVIIGLSLANEGLPWQPNTEQIAQGIGQVYRAGLLSLAQTAEQANATVVIGGVYPHDLYQSFQTAELWNTDTILKTWPYKYLDFMTQVSDANGHWLSGLKRNNGHPNDAGHTKMYQGIDVGYFGQFSCVPSPPAPPRTPPAGAPSVGAPSADAGEAEALA